MLHFLYGFSFGLFTWLWWRESSKIGANPKKQFVWMAGMVLSVFAAWLL